MDAILNRIGLLLNIVGAILVSVDVFGRQFSDKLLMAIVSKTAEETNFFGFIRTSYEHVVEGNFESKRIVLSLCLLLAILFGVQYFVGNDTIVIVFRYIGHIFLLSLMILVCCLLSYGFLYSRSKWISDMVGDILRLLFVCSLRVLFCIQLLVLLPMYVIFIAPVQISFWTCLRLNSTKAHQMVGMILLMVGFVMQFIATFF